MAQPNSKMDSLEKILRQEKSRGFQDTTVIGGLDRFIQRWSDELQTVLEDQVSYSVLTPPQREDWAMRLQIYFSSIVPIIDSSFRVS